jgi:nicotinate (nicotinamide) nucleotide adenylyltransferase
LVNLISTRRLGVQVGLFGGSFNPPHVGHAMVVSWLLWTEQVDEVWLMPAFEHPLDKALIPFSQRVKACEALASLFSDQVKVCEIERDLPRPSYTLNSLESLSEAHPALSFRLVAGSDILDQVGAWHKWDEIEVGLSGLAQLPRLSSRFVHCDSPSPGPRAASGSDGACTCVAGHSRPVLSPAPDKVNHSDWGAKGQ